MTRDELAERIVGNVFKLSIKKGIPKWPLVPLSTNLGKMWDSPIPFRADPKLLQVPTILLSDLDEELYISKTSLADKKLTRRFRRLSDPATILTRIQVFTIKDKTKEAGDFVVGINRGQYQILGPTKTSTSIKWNGDYELIGGCILEDVNGIMAIAPGVRTVLEASWVARIRLFDDGPSIELPTNPEGVYALFKDRTAEGGRKKRLLHWVKEHCRVLKTKQVKVAEHLRGISSFTWQDTEVRITPPADSLERAAQKTKVAPSVLHAIERYRKLMLEYSEES